MNLAGVMSDRKATGFIVITLYDISRKQIRAAPKRERETLHLFQPPRAGQMSSRGQSQCHKIRPNIL